MGDIGGTKLDSNSESCRCARTCCSSVIESGYGSWSILVAPSTKLLSRVADGGCNIGMFSFLNACDDGFGDGCGGGCCAVSPSWGSGSSLGLAEMLWASGAGETCRGVEERASAEFSSSSMGYRVEAVSE